MGRFDTLHDHQFINLTTFRRTGTAVVTPVWFVLYDGRLTVMTARASGKVTRIRHRADVLVAPSTREGKQIGPEQPGRARVMELEESSSSFKALGRKYGWLFRIFRFVQKVRRTDIIVLEIEPT